LQNRESVNPSAASLEPHRVAKPDGLQHFRFVKHGAKRCHELSYLFVLRYEGWSLVQGLIYGPSIIPHSWAERGNVVYDGTCKGFYDRVGYYSVMDVEPLVRYDRRRTRELVLEQGYYGLTDEFHRKFLLKAKAQKRRNK
jgi:hypothetical protein